MITKIHYDDKTQGGKISANLLNKKIWQNHRSGIISSSKNKKKICDIGKDNKAHDKTPKICEYVYDDDTML